MILLPSFMTFRFYLDCRCDAEIKIFIRFQRFYRNSRRLLVLLIYLTGQFVSMKLSKCGRPYTGPMSLTYVIAWDVHHYMYGSYVITWTHVITWDVYYYMGRTSKEKILDSIKVSRIRTLYTIKC